jgi:hypothetical protein
MHVLGRKLLLIVLVVVVVCQQGVVEVVEEGDVVGGGGGRYRLERGRSRVGRGRLQNLGEVAALRGVRSGKFPKFSSRVELSHGQFPKPFFLFPFPSLLALFFDVVEKFQ